ncbi:MAG: DUF885 family protein, partial [Lachnospiraceae bacterium]|nr:DUF885 family protein [Lachnospiraceae bacterium]
MNTEKIKGRFRRKHLLVVATAILFFIGVTIFLFLYHKDEHRFTKMTNTLFRDEMSQNTLNMHYTLAYPENFGIYDYNAVLPAYSAESKQKGQEQTKEVLETLSKINPNRLPDNQQYTYRLLKNALETALTMSGYPYYQEPLSPASGMQTQLPILLAEYSFRNKKDVEDYLELLNQTDEYFDSLVVYEQEKAKAGLFMNSLSLEKVLTQCETILTKESLLAGDHFLQTTFVERLEDLYKQETITREEAKYYIAQNNRLLSTVLMPAYEALYDGLFVLEDETIALEGLGSKPEGAAYYELLLRSETGSNRDIAQIKKMLTTQLETEFGALHQLLTDHQDLILSDYSYELDRAFPYQSPKQMLPDLQERMAQDFPPLVNAKPQVYVKSV